MVGIEKLLGCGEIGVEFVVEGESVVGEKIMIIFGGNFRGWKQIGKVFVNFRGKLTVNTKFLIMVYFFVGPVYMFVFVKISFILFI